MKRRFAIVVGLILFLSAMPVMVCQDCVPSGEKESVVITAASCCTAQCAMKQLDPCSGADLRASNGDAPMVPAVPSASAQERPLAITSFVDGDASSWVATKIVTIELDDSHDPPGPPLTILHSQFLI